MSKAKFAAAKELIQERHYDAARAVLQTMNDPTAYQWLQTLEQVAPAYPEHSSPITKEQERFYRGQNRDRRRYRIGRGIELLAMAVVIFSMFAVFAAPEFSNKDGNISLGLECFLLPLGAVALVAGLRFLLKD